jgi:hypothetical protein
MLYELKNSPTIKAYDHRRKDCEIDASLEELVDHASNNSYYTVLPTGSVNIYGL